MRSIWEAGHFERRWDLVVVGGGLTGWCTALYHQRARPGHRVLVLERGPHPSGASVKNAGFACFGSPSELLSDLSTEGADAMLARVEERWRGLQELRQELGDAAIGYEPSGGHEVFHADEPLYTRVADGFDELNRMLVDVFGRPPFHWAANAAGNWGLAAGTVVASTPLEGALDSGALMRSLMQRGAAAGVLFRTNSPVAAIDDQANGVDLLLGDGSRVEADRVVIATNGYAGELLPGIDILPARGQVLLTHPIPGLKLRGTFHYDEGYYYFRDHQGAVLLGGARNLDKGGETTLEEGTTPQIQERLEEFMRSVVLPGVPFTVRQRWSGIMGFRSAGKTPLVERRGERLVVAAGLSGMGVAIGIRVARRAAALLADQP